MAGEWTTAIACLLLDVLWWPGVPSSGEFWCFQWFLCVYMRGRARCGENRVSGVFSVFKSGKMVFWVQHTTNTEKHQSGVFWCFLVFFGGFHPPVYDAPVGGTLAIVCW